MGTHGETRVNEDNTPDMDLHDHVLIMNQTWDQKANGGRGAWKAIEAGRIVQKLPFYEAMYHNHMAYLLRTVGGYGIERRGKVYKIAGISNELRDCFSRRRKHIKEVAEKLGITSAEGFDKLGATTRRGKTDMIEAELHDCWLARLTPEWKQELQRLRGRPSHVCDAAGAIQYACDHEFYRNSIVREDKLWETALRRRIGLGTLEEIEKEARRGGVRLKDGEATTRDVLAQERRIIDMAREGRGTMRPLGAGRTLDPKVLAKLSADQASGLTHIWHSADQVILIRGGAGTGKTTMMRPALERLNCPMELLAPSAEASRSELRASGFKDANTVASFLIDARHQAAVKNGLIYVDEAGMLPIDDLEKLCGIAKAQKARLVLQGDPRQHKAVSRHGNMLRALHTFGGLPVAELKDIKRQSGRYKEAVAAIQAGDQAQGYDILSELGWVHRLPSEDIPQAVARDYCAALGRGESVICIGITHKQNDAINAEIRKILKETPVKGKDGKPLLHESGPKKGQPVMAVDGEDRVFTTYRNLGWSDAEKADPERYDGSEMVQFHRRGGGFEAGQRVEREELFAPGCRADPKHYAVYAQGTTAFAVGDHIRATAGGRDIARRNGKWVRGDFRIDNGYTETIASFTPEGHIRLENGKVLAKDFGHITHAYSITSMKGQSATKMRTLTAPTREAMGAIGAPQWLVDVSRGSKSAGVYTDLPERELKDCIEQQDERKAAVEVFGLPKPAKRRMMIPPREYVQWLRAKRRKARAAEVKARAEAEPWTLEMAMRLAETGLPEIGQQKPRPGPRRPDKDREPPERSR